MPNPLCRPLMVGGLMLLSSVAWAGAPAAMGGGLSQLVAAWEAGDPRLGEALDLHLVSPLGQPMVKILLNDGVGFEQVQSELATLGFELSAVSVLDGRLVEGFLPLSSARAAAALPGVTAVHAEQRPQHNAGKVQSQAVALQKANLAQGRGITGQGIRIGVLSDSFDTCASCFTHAAQDVASGDLPVVTVLQDFPGGTDEGRAMLQLIHDVAPDAALAFATADTGQVGFANNIIALRKKFHADVIVDDVVYFAEPMYSDGVIAQAVDFVAGDGAAYFSSAGNNGVEAYEATYQAVPYDRAKKLLARGGSNINLDTIPPELRPASIHNFAAGDDDGGDDDGGFALSQSYSTAGVDFISFQWDEPFYLGKVKTDYNIYVFDGAGNWQDPFSDSFPGFYTTDDNTATDAPFEIVILVPFFGEIHGGANVSDFQIVIGNKNGGPARHVKYVTVNNLGISERQGAGSIFGHAAAAGGQAVAATYYAVPSFPEDFSAGGPTVIRLDAQGNRLREPQVRGTPQITAADGCDTTFFGFDSDGNGLPNFFGTSAAAPNAAATAALVLQAAGGPGSLSPQDLYRRLQRTASPIPTADDRGWAAAFAGPLAFSASHDWTRWSRYFGLAVQPFTHEAIQSVTLDVGPANQVFSANPARFHIGASSGVTLGQITRTRSANGHKLTLGFAPGSFGPGSLLRFGMSVFDPIQGSTQEDADRFRGALVSVKTESGKSFTGTVFASPQLQHNRYTGFGLLDADAATRRHHDDDGE